MSVDIIRNDSSTFTPNFPGSPRIVTPTPRGQWEVADLEKAEETRLFPNVDAALQQAYRAASSDSSAVYLLDSGGAILDRFEFYGDFDEGSFQVFPSEEGDWVLARLSPKEEEARYERFDTKKEALSKARGLARDEETTLRIHYQSGELQKTLDYN